MSADQKTLTHLLDKSPGVTYACEPSGEYVVTSISEGVTDQLGFSPEEFIGNPGFWMAHIHPNDREGVLAGLGRLYTQGFAAYEYRFMHRDGSYRLLLDQLRLLRDDKGDPLEIVGCWLDRTLIQNPATSAAPEGERFRELIETTLAVPWVASAETWRFTYVGPQGVALLGYPLEAWYEENFWESHIHPEDREWVIEFCSRCSSSRDNYDFEYRMLAADGRTVWLHDVVNVVGRAGEPYLLQGFLIDITAFKQARDLVLRSEAMSRAIISSVASHIAVLDKDGEIIAVNEAWLRFGRDNDVTTETKIAPGTNYLEACRSLQGTDSREVKEVLSGIQAVLDGSRRSFEVEYSCPTPTQDRWFLMSVSPLEHREGGAVVSHVDITKHKRMELQLKEAFAEIQRLKNRLEVDNTYLREEIHGHSGLHETVGESEAIRSVLRHVEWVAVTEATVLIMGETGTGKELIARTLHRLSPRSHRPLIKVDCAALPATLIETELFGHERGAFTDAQSKRIGRFELADGATIFLDEIGELPLALQAKLLRVLQDGEFERLGSTKLRRVNIRVIAATNRDLRQAMKEGSFREDLYFRLNVYPIEVPPLRERIEDIPRLVSHFIKKRQGSLGKTIESVSPDLIEAFREYHWPGNIRELENVVEHALIVSRGSRLTLPDGLLGKTPHAVNQDTPSWQAASSFRPDIPIKTSLDEAERQAISRAVAEAGWRIKGKGGAAERLGLKPSTLRSRLKKLGIERPT